MSKVKTINAFATQYENFTFKNQMYAMGALARSLGVHMFFYSSQTNGMADNLATTYQFQTFNGRNLIKITLKNAQE